MEALENQKPINLESNPTPAPTVLDPNRLLWFASGLICLCVACLVWACAAYVQNASVEPAKQVFELAKTTIPPLITLILGFYFGGRHHR